MAQEQDDFNLERFVTAQARSYSSAVRELKAGHKTSHWMWYVFPQIQGLGMSILSGAHRFLFPKVVELLKERNAEDIVVFGGGIIPEEDVPFLKEKGVRAIFTPGASTEDIISWVRENIKPWE